MGTEEFDQGEERAASAARRPAASTERLSSRETASFGDTTRTDWRGSRGAARARRPASAMPTSREEFVIWLQHGGWRMALAVVGVLALLLMLLIVRRPGPMAIPQNTLPAEDSGQVLIDPLPTVTPLLEPSPAPLIGGMPFQVFNTGVEGLFLRPAPNQDNQPIKTLPEGTIVTVIGEDSPGSGYIWKHVRDPEGAEGWVASDYLAPLQ